MSEKYIGYQERESWRSGTEMAIFEFSKEPKQGVISMMSDIRKHPETNSEALTSLCMMTLMGPCSEKSVREFINGFN